MAKSMKKMPMKMKMGGKKMAAPMKPDTDADGYKKGGMVKGGGKGKAC